MVVASSKMALAQESSETLYIVKMRCNFQYVIYDLSLQFLRSLHNIV